MTSISGVGIELWSMSENIYFDNLLITDNLVHANKYAGDTFDLKMSKIDASTGGMFRYARFTMRLFCNTPVLLCAYSVICPFYYAPIL